MKIYTKTGDSGTTRLVDGSCVEKFNPRVEAYGTVDELNSSLGLLISFVENNRQSQLQKPHELHSTLSDLLKIQHWLFNAGSLLATIEPQIRLKLPQIENFQIVFLETRIDSMTEELQPLKNFILPGGHLTSSQAHVCRTICRRAERRSAEITVADQTLGPVLIFLNRLSDYFFTLARYLNSHYEKPEIIWEKDLNV